MSHGVWKGRLEAYAEGELRWPLTLLVESHTKHCQACRHELRSMLAFMRQVDMALFTPDEMARTAASVTRREVMQSDKQGRRAYGLSMRFAGAALALLALASIPIGMQLFSPGVTVMAASSWSEGVATAIPVEVSGQDAPGTQVQSPMVSSGTGVAVPVPAPEERGV